MKGYLNFDMLGCNNNEEAYPYGLSLHESVPCFQWLAEERYQEIRLESDNGLSSMG